MGRPENHSTYCAFPYEMYSVDTQFGIWRPCPRIDYLPLQDGRFNGHERLVELRENLQNGMRDPLCSRCWTDEERGVKSYRQVLKQDYFDERFLKKEIPSPKILEIKFSNICNLKCVFCSSLCSSLWEREIPLEKKPLSRSESQQLEEDIMNYLDLHYNNIQVIQIFGGEPVLHDGFFKVLDYLILQGEKSVGKTLSLSTNLFFPPKLFSKLTRYIEKLLAVGVKFFFRVSIDGVGDKGEYLRTGLDWESFERNFIELSRQIQGSKNFGRIRCNIALNALNLLSLHEIMSYLDGCGIDSIEPHYNYIGKPERFSLSTYGHRLKHASEKVSQQNFSRFQPYKDHVLELIGSMTHLEPDHDVVSECGDWLRQHDLKNRKGKGSFFEVFPENTYLFDA
jgi:MoaA/NifB/PqqE/SkfB family radical SAM enzyme